MWLAQDHYKGFSEFKKESVYILERNGPFHCANPIKL